jgi:alpha-L-rhamnosidase
MGATTIWERWDSMLPDGSINSGEMTSFNHYALGAVADWMHRTIGGITPAEPGYRTIRIAPQPGGGLSWVKASLATRRGTVTVGWSIIDAVFTLDVHVPDGCRAEVVVPGGVPVTVGSGQHTFHTGLDDDWATERARVG